LGETQVFQKEEERNWPTGRVSNKLMNSTQRNDKKQVTKPRHVQKMRTHRHDARTAAERFDERLFARQTGKCEGLGGGEGGGLGSLWWVEGWVGSMSDRMQVVDTVMHISKKKSRSSNERCQPYGQYSCFCFSAVTCAAACAKVERVSADAQLTGIMCAIGSAADAADADDRF
jgi:hypothetical protein